MPGLSLFFLPTVSPPRRILLRAPAAAAWIWLATVARSGDDRQDDTLELYCPRAVAGDAPRCLRSFPHSR